jgi:hypothetical protein
VPIKNLINQSEFGRVNTKMTSPDFVKPSEEIMQSELYHQNFQSPDIGGLMEDAINCFSSNENSAPGLENDLNEDHEVWVGSKGAKIELDGHNRCYLGNTFGDVGVDGNVMIIEKPKLIRGVTEDSFKKSGRREAGLHQVRVPQKKKAIRTKSFNTSKESIDVGSVEPKILTRDVKNRTAADFYPQLENSKLTNKTMNELGHKNLTQTHPKPAELTCQSKEIFTTDTTNPEISLLNHIERLSMSNPDKSFGKFKEFIGAYTYLPIPERIELFRQSPHADLGNVFSHAQGEKNNLMDLLFH